MSEHYLTLPDGFTMPQGAQEGEEFDVSCRVKIEDGKLCVKKINGMPLPDAGMKDEDADAEPKMSMMDAARKDGYA